MNHFSKIKPLVDDFCRRARARCTWVVPSGNMRNMDAAAYRRARSYVRYVEASLREKRERYLEDIILYGRAEFEVTPSDFKQPWQPPKEKRHVQPN